MYYGDWGHSYARVGHRLHCNKPECTQVGKTCMQTRSTDILET